MKYALELVRKKLVSYHFVIIILITIISSMDVFSQGLNNKYSIDSTDIYNVVQMLGMDIFKFPLNKQDENYKLKINVETYQDHKLLSKDVLTNGIIEDYMGLSEEINTLRVYKQSINDSTIGLRISIEGVTISQQVEFDKDTLGMQQCRAYSKFQPEFGKAIPIFIWYAFGKGKTDSMHCPGDSPLTTVVDLYDFVIAITIELDEKKK